MKVISKQIQLCPRTIVISDVHGNGHLLSRLLKKCQYEAGKDTLILLGDLIEKGKDSLGTLHLVMELAKQPNVEVIMGNCDAIPLEILDRKNLYGLCHYLMNAPWKEHTLLQEMAKACGYTIDLAQDYMQTFQDLLAAYPDEFAFLNALPHVLESESYLFVHAGVEQEYAPYAQNAHTIMKNDRFAAKPVQFQKTLVCGHTPVVNYQEGIVSSNVLYDEQRNIFSIDGGCGVKMDGQLNALILNQDGTWQSCYEDDLEKRIIQVSYQAKEQCVHSIHWFERFVDVVKTSEQGTLCIQKSSGAQLLVPNDALYESKEGICCNDFTDYHMSVEKGEEVSIIREWNNEVYVKKQGIHGWIPKDVLS